MDQAVHSDQTTGLTLSADAWHGKRSLCNDFPPDEQDLRQHKHDQGNRNHGAASDGLSDPVDRTVCCDDADKQPGGSQNCTGGKDRRKSEVHRLDDGLFSVHGLCVVGISIGNYDSIVDVGAHLDGADHQLRHKEHVLMHQCGIPEIHPDCALDDCDQQDRHSGGVEGKEKHNKNDQNRNHTDHYIIDLEGLLEFVLVGGVAHHIDITLRVMLLGDLTDRIRKTEGLVAGFGQGQIDQHPVIVFTLQLAFAHQHLGSRVFKGLGLFSFEVDISFIHLIPDIKEYIDQRDTVF